MLLTASESFCSVRDLFALIFFHLLFQFKLVIEYRLHTEV